MRAFWADLPNLKMAISQNWLSQIACNFIQLQILVKHTILWCQLQNTFFRLSKMAIQAEGGPVMALMAPMAYGLWQEQVTIICIH